jgi:molybdenum cofactor guanylyltransferase
MRQGAIVLCGGRSSRMGRDKALLPFGPHEVMLERIVRIVCEVVPVERVLCVATTDQVLPPLGGKIRVTRDPHPHQGPLAGLATGLAELRDEVDAVFVCGCDAPLILPEYVDRMFAQLADHQIAAPDDGQRLYPLSAVYRRGVRPEAESLLAAGERRLLALVERCDTRGVPIEELRDVDPERLSLENCNTFAEYQRLLERAFPERRGP